MSLYRIYIDEFGNHDLRHVDNENERFLSLTGVIIQSEHNRDVIKPQMDEVKNRFLTNDPDEVVILHRKEILKRIRTFCGIARCRGKRRF